MEPAVHAIGDTAKLHTVDCHLPLQALARRVHGRFLAANTACLDHPPAAMARRLTQRVLAHAYRPYMRLCLAREARPSPPIPQAGETLDLAHLKIDVATGAVSCGIRLWLASVATFALYWLFLLGLALKGAASPARRGTLVHGVGRDTLMAGGNDTRFLDFCRAGPLAELRSASRLYVQSVAPIQGTEPSRVTYARYPLAALLGQGLGPAALPFFLWRHVRAALAFAALALRQPGGCLLARDLAFDAAARALDREGSIEALLLTGSNFTEQMLWMSHRPARGFRTAMAFYSVNSLPFVYRSRPQGLANPTLEYLTVDRFYVWSEGHIGQVRSWGLDTPCDIAGPLVFQNPGPAAPTDAGVLQIAVFDVTPVTDAAARDLGIVNPYYRAETLRRFIEDILAAGISAAGKTGRRLRVVLKPKRRYDDIHDRDYIAALHGTAAAGVEVRIAPVDENLHALVASSDVTIAVPYSSPVYISAALGRPAIYHDAAGELVPTHDPSPLVHFTATRAELERVLLETTSR